MIMEKIETIIKKAKEVLKAYFNSDINLKKAKRQLNSLNVFLNLKKVKVNKNGVRYFDAKIKGDNYKIFLNF